MNLEESDSYKDVIESRERKRRGVMLSIILCAVFAAMLVFLIVIISYEDSITEKFFINGEQTKSLSNSIYTDIDGVTYIDVKKFSSILGYTYTKGEYKKYNENEDSCYLQNDFEIVALTSGKDSYDKYIELAQGSTIAGISVTSKNENGYSENFELSSPIVYQNEKIYVPLDSLSKMFNIQIDWKEYRKHIYTLENRIQYAQNAITKAKYAEMSGFYENLRAIIDGFVIVGDAEEASAQGNSKYYGVYSLNEGREVISLKYDEITYVQNVSEFYITVENGTMGILNNEGGTIIAPSEFENISLLDGENQLYLVRKGQEYGVVGRTGKQIIYAENDKVGLDEKEIEEYTLEPIENGNLLFGKCIPVEKDGKMGLYNKDGNMLLNLAYDGFGYKSTATSKTSGNEQSVLLIPSSVGINGIVINLNDSFGIFDVTSEQIILPCSYSKIYAITKNGKTTYYADYEGKTIDLKEYLYEQGLNNVTEEDEDSKSNKDNLNETDTNTISNTSVEDDNLNITENQTKEPTVVETN